MLEQVAAAFRSKDYQTATKLLAQLVKQEPDNPWVQLYVARLHEVNNQRSQAESVYRELLRNTTHQKVLGQARQGLKRLQDLARKERQLEKEERRQAIAQAKADPEREPSVLILQSIITDAKKLAAQKLARIMDIDIYNARMLLPTNSWRLYRVGTLGEIKFFGQQLQKAEIPSFWVTIAEVEKIQVLRVNYFQTSTSQVTVICENEFDQVGSLTFDWSEISQRVEGLLPIFEEVLDRDVRHQLQRKTQILDYAQIYDLHLPKRGVILRVCDYNYQFQQGINFIEPQQNQTTKFSSSLQKGTIRTNWNNLINFITQQLPQTPIRSDFTNFAETALVQIELLESFESHINLLRKKETSWDQAFQLFSGLVFLKGNGEQ